MIRLEGVSFGYEKDVPAIKCVSFNVDDGERVALLGPNGAGKSTILKLVAGLIRPEQGRISISGRELTKGNAQELRQLIGFLFQEPDDQIFLPSVWEDVAFGPSNLGLSDDEINERVDEAMRLIGLEDFGQRVPHKLSTGEKKRVAIAGILAMRPKILLLDEPFSSLDYVTRSTLLELLASLDVTLLVATQDADVAVELADRVVLLNRRKIADGSMRETFSSSAVMNEAGLELPEISKLFASLRAEGFAIDELPLTAEEGRRYLHKILTDDQRS